MDAAIYHHNSQRNQNISIAWHTAMFTRQKKIPKLETLLIDLDGKKVAKQPEPWEVSFAKMSTWAMQSKRKH